MSREVQIQAPFPSPDSVVEVPQTEEAFSLVEEKVVEEALAFLLESNEPNLLSPKHFRPPWMVSSQQMSTYSFQKESDLAVLLLQRQALVLELEA
jgi:hypothetical protein